jgi:hypothetical protein
MGRIPGDLVVCSSAWPKGAAAHHTPPQQTQKRRINMGGRRVAATPKTLKTTLLPTFASLAIGGKRRGLLSAVLCPLLVFAAVQAGGTSLISNGDFETGDFTGWTLNFTPPNDAAVVLDEEFLVYQGEYLVNFSWNDVPATAVIAQIFDTVKHSAYDVKFAFGTMS